MDDGRLYGTCGKIFFLSSVLWISGTDFVPDDSGIVPPVSWQLLLKRALKVALICSGQGAGGAGRVDCGDDTGRLIFK